MLRGGGKEDLGMRVFPTDPSVGGERAVALIHPPPVGCPFLGKRGCSS